MMSTDPAPPATARVTAAASASACATRSPVPSPGSVSTSAVRPVARIRPASTLSDSWAPPYPGTSSTGPGRAGAAADRPDPTTRTTRVATRATSSRATAPSSRRRRGLSPVQGSIGSTAPW
jgi:hypothetical protein